MANNRELSQFANVVGYNGGSIGIGTTNPTAKLTINPLTTLSTSGDIGGVSIANTENKTYPTTSSFAVTLGLNQNNEVGGTQVINPSTPGGYNYISGIRNALTKTNDNTQDVERSYYYGINQSFNWQDQNTCKQYVSINDAFTYAGINTNGRTSSSFNVGNRITLRPPEGGTQTIANASTNSLWLWGNSTSGTDTINITGARGLSIDLRFVSFSSGTHNYNITNYSAFEIPSYWGTINSAGTLNATITNYYGIKLVAPSSSTGLTVTNNYGIYSGWSDSKNYFAGSVGIGTDNPTSDLSVVSYGDHGKIRVESSGDGNRAGVEFFRESSAGTGKGAAGIWVESETGNSTGELRFGTASNAGLQSLSTKMILDSSGDLGIGTDNPQANLHIFEGTGSTRAPAASGNNLVIDSNSEVGMSLLFGTDANTAYGNIYWGNSTDGASDGRITYFGSTYTTAADRQAMVFRTANTERLRITGGGVLRGGSSASTSGSTLIENRYSGEDILNVIGSMYSTGNLSLGYGLRPKSGGSGYTSSFDNFSGKRAALQIGQGTFEFHATAGSSATTTGSDIGTTVRLKIDDNGHLIYDTNNGGIYNFDKACSANASTNIFRIDNSHGAHCFTIYMTGSNSGNSVSKIYNVACKFGSAPTISSAADTGAYSGNNFSLTGSVSSQVHTFAISVTGAAATISCTVVLGSMNTSATVTVL